MNKVGEIIDFSIDPWQVIELPAFGKVVKLPIEIKDIETGQTSEFQYFIWGKDGRIISQRVIPKTKILYSVEDRAGYEVLRFKVLPKTSVT